MRGRGRDDGVVDAGLRGRAVGGVASRGGELALEFRAERRLHARAGGRLDGGVLGRVRELLRLGDAKGGVFLHLEGTTLGRVRACVRGAHLELAARGGTRGILRSSVRSIISAASSRLIIFAGLRDGERFTKCTGSPGRPERAIDRRRDWGRRARGAKCVNNRDDQHSLEPREHQLQELCWRAARRDFGKSDTHGSGIRCLNRR